MVRINISDEQQNKLRDSPTFNGGRGIVRVKLATKFCSLQEMPVDEHSLRDGREHPRGLYGSWPKPRDGYRRFHNLAGQLRDIVSNFTRRQWVPRTIEVALCVQYIYCQ